MTCDLTIDILCDVYGFDRKWPMPPIVALCGAAAPQCARLIASDDGRDLWLMAHCDARRVELGLLVDTRRDPVRYQAIRLARVARTELDVAQILHGLLPLEA